MTRDQLEAVRIFTEMLNCCSCSQPLANQSARSSCPWRRISSFSRPSASAPRSELEQRRRDASCSHRPGAQPSAITMEVASMRPWPPKPQPAPRGRCPCRRPRAPNRGDGYDGVLVLLSSMKQRNCAACCPEHAVAPSRAQESWRWRPARRPWRRPSRTSGDGIQFPVLGWTVNQIPSTPRPLATVGSQSSGQDRHV